MKNKELDYELVPERWKESENVPKAAAHFCKGVNSIEDNNYNNLISTLVSYIMKLAKQICKIERGSEIV